MESNVEQLKMFDHYCTEHGSDLDIDGWDYSKIVLYLTVKIVRLHGADAVHGRKEGPIEHISEQQLRGATHTCRMGCRTIL